MSLITQCPACSTMFKVVPDQLRISDGWVRCGQCDEVFDANVHLFSEPQPALVSEAPPSPHVAITSPDPAWAASLKFAEDEQPALSSAPLEQSFESPVGAPEAEVEREPKPEAALDAPDDFLSQSPAALVHGTADELGAISPGDEGLAQDPALDASAAVPRYVQTEAPLRDAQADSAHLSFMRNARGSTVWQRTSIRVVLAVGALLALTGLLLQIALHERDRLAAIEPASRPALLQMCEWLSCTVSPLRNIEAVVIDSSSFTKVRTDVYRLHVAIKNTGPVALAPPAFELTLTDMQDQSLVRRVFAAKEAGFSDATLAAGAEFAAVLPIAVKTGSSSERVSGYRLLAFYP
ncbi:zinc-ribbon and DUF3426 domain-containing protein [Rhodoferax bucti]|uniref:zinc-ribbon and DUF3426 domain-containing protein n=1 Tax=Rhodoferax bucti TaxID=2576305 RepID=UPI001107C773|nr:zinc-ribbon and DUF3426 domain-containing protein [Rhodoferax bucti]